MISKRSPGREKSAAAGRPKRRKVTGTAMASLEIL
jgi:hypothetical protein